MCIEGNPNLCPKPCPSVSYCLKADKNEETDSKDSFVETETESFQNENTFSCSEQEQTQLGELFSNPEVESDNLTLVLLIFCMVKWMKIVFIKRWKAMI